MFIFLMCILLHFCCHWFYILFGLNCYKLFYFIDIYLFFALSIYFIKSFGNRLSYFKFWRIKSHENFWLTVWKRWFSGKRHSERLIIGLLTIIMIVTKNWRMNILHIIRDGHKELNHSIVHYIYRKLNHAILEHIKSNLMFWIQCLQRFCSQLSKDRRM